MYRNDDGSIGREEEEKEVELKVPKWRLEQWFPRLSNEAHEKLKAYHGELLRFNKVTNLISPRTAENCDLIHFADSVLGAQIIFASTEEKKIYDIGSGNGFPGLILGILGKDREIVLVDSDMRKIDYLKHMIHFLKLDNVSVLHSRLEDIKPGTIQCAVSRAFAPLPKAMNFRASFGPGAHYFQFKSDSWGTELIKVPIQIGRYWDPKVVGEYSLPGISINLAIVDLVRNDI